MTLLFTMILKNVHNNRINFNPKIGKVTDRRGNAQPEVYGWLIKKPF